MRQVHREIQMDIEHDCTTNSLKSVEATDCEFSLHVYSLVNAFPHYFTQTITLIKPYSERSTLAIIKYTEYKCAFTIKISLF